jgi:CRP-like cAMP-binding protein
MVNDCSNRVICALPARERRTVLGSCAEKDFEVGTVLARVGEKTPCVVFPETAVISTLATYGDGSVIEMANVGREACAGIGLILGHDRQLTTNQIQVRGTALVLPAAPFAELRDSLPVFRDVLFSAVQAVFFQVMVSGACNGAHTASQRLARWLLTMYDRSDGQPLHLTQEFLAEILGLRRATVTAAASDLQREGTIAYARGRIRILDHAALRGASCECYDRVREAYDKLLPRRTGRG